MFKEILFVSFLFHGLICCYGDTSANSSTSKLILVSFDGFRADYLTKFPLPNLNAFIKEGVLVEHVKNVFITKTFPNHYSLVTGLYAESHGIVANSMYDPEIKRVFTMANSSDPVWWNEATPIWVTNQLQGHKSGSGMWPGSEVHIHNMTIDNMKYNRNVSFAERVDTVTSWFTRAKDPINFATLYWEEPDSSGHHFGPDDHKNMTEVLRSVDEDVGYLMSKLKNLSLWDSVNVIITSDHGMAQLSKDRVIELDKCIGRENYILVDDTPVAAILPLQDKMYVYGLLKDCHPNMKAYLKEDIPERYHYKHNSRIQPIILVADLGWTIMQNGSLKTLGNHGYDNEFPSMHPFLAARGPAFHKGYKMDTINSVDVYPMMCHILRLKAEPNNGTLANTKCLLVDEWCIHIPEAIGIVIGVIMVLTTLTCVIVLLKKKLPSTRPFSRLEFQEDDDPLIG